MGACGWPACCPSPLQCVLLVLHAAGQQLVQRHARLLVQQERTKLGVAPAAHRQPQQRGGGVSWLGGRGLTSSSSHHRLTDHRELTSSSSHHRLTDYRGLISSSSHHKLTDYMLCAPEAPPLAPPGSWSHTPGSACSASPAALRSLAGGAAVGGGHRPVHVHRYGLPPLPA